MGICPSRTEYLLSSPYESIRVCSPSNCWCNFGPHRTSRYVYVERGGGRERCMDPVDLIGEFMMGSGLLPMPWTDAREWTVRDYERLGDIMDEYFVRQRCRRRNGRGLYRMPYSGIMPPFEDYNRSLGRRRRHSSWFEYERLQAELRQRMRRMEEYFLQMEERDDLLFGTERETRKEQYRANMLRTLQEIMPQFSQMMVQQQMRGNAFGVMGPAAGIMPPPFGAGPMGGMGSMQMPGVVNPIAGIGPLETAMGVDPDILDPEVGFDGIRNGVDRRPSTGRHRRTQLHFADDEDVYTLGEPRRRGFRWRSRWDDDDVLGGYGRF